MRNSTTGGGRLADLSQLNESKEAKLERKTKISKFDLLLPSFVYVKHFNTSFFYKSFSVIHVNLNCYIYI